MKVRGIILGRTLHISMGEVDQFKIHYIFLKMNEASRNLTYNYL